MKAAKPATSADCFTFREKLYYFMTQSKLLYPFYWFAKRTGVHRLVGHVVDAYDSSQPLKIVRKEKAYFPQHRKELQTVYDMLSDERSKRVFKEILMSRATGKECLNDVDSPENQYFVPEIQFSDHEVIVDCGAFIGDTAEKFFKAAPGCRVVALEPDEKNYSQLVKMEGDNLKAYQCGAWSKDTTLKFDGGGGGGSKISDFGKATIAVRALDHIPECQDATYIKMDIEGSELEALRGAEQIIKRNKPKLAICLYHKSQDFFEIPLYIKSLVPDYKFYVYHHFVCIWGDTVLYAIPE